MNFTEKLPTLLPTANWTDWMFDRARCQSNQSEWLEARSASSLIHLVWFNVASFRIVRRTLKEAKFREKEHFQAFIAGRANLTYVFLHGFGKDELFAMGVWEILIHNVTPQSGPVLMTTVFLQSRGVYRTVIPVIVSGVELTSIGVRSQGVDQLVASCLAVC